MLNSLMAFTIAVLADPITRALVGTQLGRTVITSPWSRTETLVITADATIFARSLASANGAVVARVSREAFAPGVETSSVCGAVVGANCEVKRAIRTKIFVHALANSLFSAHTTVRAVVGALTLVAKVTLEAIKTDTLVSVGVTFTLFAVRAGLLVTGGPSKPGFASTFELWFGSYISMASTIPGTIRSFTTTRCFAVLTGGTIQADTSGRASRGVETETITRAIVGTGREVALGTRVGIEAVARAVDTFTIRATTFGVCSCAHTVTEFALVAKKTCMAVTGWLVVVEVASSMLTTAWVGFLIGI